jgi:hypothetical protein
MPYTIHGMVPTRIGDPLSPNSPRYRRPAAQQQWPFHNEHNEVLVGNEVMVRHMGRTEDMERSRRIIEIGALTARAQQDSTLQDHGDTTLKKLADVERYLKAECVGCDDALRGCAAIREVLTRMNLVALPHEM